jgi:hypothetical protein
MTNVDTYTLQEEEGSGKLRFFFESVGEEEVVKLVEYGYIQPLEIGHLYNLGFGDYDIETGTILDDVNTNNGDMWPVLNTVLSTIPQFFDEHPFDTIAVQGSDSVPGFEERCRPNCENPRRCKTVCRNLNRRINSYRYFLDKHYAELTQTYVFFGYIRALQKRVPYRKEVKYDAIFVTKKQFPLLTSS